MALICHDTEEDETDEDFDPSGKKTKKKAKAKPLSATSAALEQARPDAHTLQEHHAFLLSSSFQENDYEGAGFVSSSSQMGGFGLEDNLGDIGAEIGDELARELGWGLPSDLDFEYARTFLLLRDRPNFSHSVQSPANEEDIIMTEVDRQAEFNEDAVGGNLDDPFDISSPAQGGKKRVSRSSQLKELERPD